MQSEVGEYISFPEDWRRNWRSGSGVCVLSGMNDAAVTPAPDTVKPAGFVMHCAAALGVARIIFGHNEIRMEVVFHN